MSGWAFTSGCFRALDHEFAVRTHDAAAGRYLARVLDPLAVAGRPSRWYSLARTAGGDLSVSFDGDPVAVTPYPWQAREYLLWHVNQAAVRSVPGDLVLHAAAAEWDGRVVLVPALAQTGKTTLVAGLVRAGLRYLTDEAAAVDPATLAVRPFPKSLSLDPGSWPMLPDLAPEVTPGAEDYGRTQWQVDPRSIRPDSISAGGVAAVVVLPRLVPGAPARLDPVPPAEAALAAGRNAFNLRALGRTGLDALAHLVARAECYQLTVGDLAATSDLVAAAMGLPAGARA